MRIRTLDELKGSSDLEYFATALTRMGILRADTDRLRGFNDTDPLKLFAEGAPLYVARAPGRLDVMGGIADYSGAVVLQLPLACATTAVLQASDAPHIDIVSLRAGAPVRFTMALDDLLRGDLRDPVRLAAWFSERSADRWAAYVVGVVHACLLRRAHSAGSPTGGFRLLIESQVPEGKGVSSSAAIEVACLAVIAARYGVSMRGEEIATACQWAENHIAGAPCGIMDQMTSACGQHDRLLQLRCQPGTIEGHLPIPAGYRFYGIDSGIRHAVSGADYGTVRTASFMGYRIIADLAGLQVARDGARVRIDDPYWRGYLANIAPEEFSTRFEALLPERIASAEFLARYDGITDLVTRVQPGRTYAVRQATAHPVREQDRVTRFAELLRGLRSGADANAHQMGALMYDSHASYSACGLGSEGTDRLVDLVASVGSARELYGAKITGGGSGGTVAVFGTERAEPFVREIAAQYTRETGRSAEVFARSGPGAEQLGVLTFVF